MALSVKQHASLDCPEPEYEINVAYHADAINGASEICNGNGILTNVYGDFQALADLYTQGATGTAANSDICDDGMDVVFCIDYTGSMNSAIQGVKNGIAQIATEIDTLSSGNFRLGLVLFDGDTGTTPVYASSGYYQGLPSSQKYNQPNPHFSGGSNYITCVEKMSAVDNITSFTNNLNAISQPVNSSTGMRLGSATECGGTATYGITQGFAGQWRAAALKVVILITDDKSEENTSYFTGTVIPNLDALDIQVFHNTSLTPTSTPNNNIDIGRYKAAAEDTTPAGLYIDNLNYSSTWTTTLISGLQDLCATTTTYTCDPAPAGWYADVPVVQGTTVVYYWDGTAWTGSYSCPLPLYTVNIDFDDNITNGSVNDFPINHPNYLDIDTLTFTGNAGDVFSATASCSVAAGYQNLILNVTNVSDNTVITNTSVNNGTLEVTIQVTIQGASSESLQINGTASQIPRTLRVDVINATTDTQDANGDSQTPAGYIKPIIVEPSSGWTNMGSTYNTFAQRYDFIDTPGQIYNFDVEFVPSPSDYSLNVQSMIKQSTTLTGQGGNSFAAGLNAVSNLSLTTGSISPDLAGTITIPSVDCHVRIYINGDVNQIQYRYQLYGSDQITGATASPTVHQFDGYTGETFAFDVQADPDPGYNNVNVTTAILNTAYSGNAAITTGPTITSGNTSAEGIVTMPSGGGQGGVILGGTASQIQYTYTVTVVTGLNLSTLSWNTIILTGAAGAAVSLSGISGLGNAQYTYNITTISNNSSGVLTSTINSASTPSIDLSLTMPLGNGSATVYLTGTQAENQYNYTLDIIADPPTPNGSFANPSVTLTGALGDVITGTFTYNQAPGYTYLFSGHSSSDGAITDASYVSGQELSTTYEVTMPNGGGSGTITCDDIEENQTEYTYLLGWDTSQNPQVGTNGSVGATPITLTGEAGTQQPWQYTLTPSPSYYEISNLSTGTIHTYTGASSNWNTYNTTGTEITVSQISIAPGNAETISGYVTMPSGGGQGALLPLKVQIKNPTVDFQVNVVNNISNTTFTPTSPFQFSGGAGSAHSQTIDLTPNSGYTHDITSVTVSNTHSGAFSAQSNIADDVLTNLTMPQGGGSTTVTIGGTSTPTIVYANFTFTEEAGGSAEAQGDWDNASLQVSGVPGSTHSISNSWRTTNNGQGRSFSGGSSTTVTRSGTNYPSQDPFNGTLCIALQLVEMSPRWEVRLQCQQAVVLGSLNLSLLDSLQLLQQMLVIVLIIPLVVLHLW